MPNVTVRFPAQLQSEVDQKLVNSRYKNRSELIRYLCKLWVDGLIVPISAPKMRD